MSVFDPHLMEKVSNWPFIFWLASLGFSSKFCFCTRLVIHL